MPRRECNETNFLLLRDNLSESDLGIYYRPPTTEERQKYINSRQVRQGNRFVDNSAVCRVRGGKKIITGLRDGDFERADGQGGYRPISSSPGAPNYHEDWKNWMEQHCSDVLTALAVRVFEMPVTPGASEETEGDGQLEDLLGE